MSQRRFRNPILDLSHVCVRRGGTAILRDVSWRVIAGEHWVVLGANGSGKTSLLSAITGYLTPTEGEVSVLGRRFGEADWRALRREIGLVSSSIRQCMADAEPALETVVSGRYAMIDLWGRVTPRDRSAALKLLRQVECLPLADRPWGFLSQGERQRILIARALMAKPRLLILDEPCAGLDPVARERFLQWLDRMGRKRSSPALVLVTHHVEEIMPVFAMALVLQAGRVLAAGAKGNVLRSSVLSRAFDAKLRARRIKGRYSLTVPPAHLLVC